MRPFFVSYKAPFRSNLQKNYWSSELHAAHWTTGTSHDSKIGCIPFLLAGAKKYFHSCIFAICSPFKSYLFSVHSSIAPSISSHLLAPKENVYESAAKVKNVDVRWTYRCVAYYRTPDYVTFCGNVKEAVSHWVSQLGKGWLIEMFIEMFRI